MFTFDLRQSKHVSSALTPWHVQAVVVNPQIHNSDNSTLFYMYSNHRDRLRVTHVLFRLNDSLKNQILSNDKQACKILTLCKTEHFRKTCIMLEISW